MRPSRQFVLAVTSLCVNASGAIAEAALPVRPALAAAPVHDEEIVLPTHRGQERFILETPDAADSSAALVASPAAIAAGRPASVPGFRVYARVVAHCADRAPLDAAAAALRGGVSVAPVDRTGRALHGHWLVGAPTVRQTVALARALRADGRVERAYLDIRAPLGLRALPSDPGVASQWHIKNTATPQACVNVEPAWDAGFTGVGLTVGITEFGWDETHPDLANKFDANASQPYQGITYHGNATAGLVGAEAYNGIGGVGVAYGAKVSRQYIGSASDIAVAMAFRNDLNAVKSNSWGPPSDGTIWTISPVELQGLADAANLGRGGKGTVLLWAAGEGDPADDRTDYDPYGSNRYSIEIGAIDNHDRVSSYDEPGSSKMLVAPSSYDAIGSDGSGIYTTWVSPDYTSEFGGTSAASPIAAGVAALVLQANPNLTSRDVADVLIHSARRPNPADPGWAQNGAGLWHHYNMGFGAIDAGAAVALARTWVNRPEAVEITYPPVAVGLPIPDATPAGVTSTIAVWPHMRVERVQVVITAVHDRVGDLQVRLTAPSGFESLLAGAPRDDYSYGYDGYTFTSVRHWDENPRGAWSLNIADLSPDYTATFTQWQLRLIGSKPACPADWNFDGAVDYRDIFDFLSAWLSGRGDFNDDGLSTIQDLLDFLAAWFAGCLDGYAHG